MTRYHDSRNFDALQDQRAEASIGTGEPITLTQAVRDFLTGSPLPTTSACEERLVARTRKSTTPRVRATGTTGDEHHCETCGDVGVVGNGNAMFPEPCPECSAPPSTRPSE